MIFPFSYEAVSLLHMFMTKTCYVSFRYLDYGNAEWKQKAGEALKSLET